MSYKRQLPNWLKGLQEYVEESESPRQFWMWAGLSTIAGALQRKVWLPFGFEPIFPNLYVLIVAPPGRCRKGAPVAFVKKMLTEIGANVYVDSPTKRALTKALDSLGKNNAFMYQGKPRVHCSITLPSKELSSFLATDTKAMVEILTEIYDCHDIWEYQTSGEGKDKLYGLCTNCFFATTPSWMATNLPEEAIGGGFTSRFVLVSGLEKYKYVPIPPPPDSEIYKSLKLDLTHISTQLIGEFVWGDGAEKLFSDWYMTIEPKRKATKDERIHSMFERLHVITIKVAMCLRVAYSDDLILTCEDITGAIRLAESVLNTAGDALSDHGRSKQAVDVGKVISQIKLAGSITFQELMKLNFRNTTKTELEEIIQTIQVMGLAKLIGNKNPWLSQIVWTPPQKEARR